MWLEGCLGGRRLITRSDALDILCSLFCFSRPSLMYLYLLCFAEDVEGSWDLFQSKSVQSEGRGHCHFTPSIILLWKVKWIDAVSGLSSSYLFCEINAKLVVGIMEWIRFCYLLYRVWRTLKRLFCAKVCCWFRKSSFHTLISIRKLEYGSWYRPYTSTRPCKAMSRFVFRDQPAHTGHLSEPR